MTSMPNVLEIEDLNTWFFTREGVAKAVNGVSFHIEKGEILGVVGESGCGKSVTASSILRLVPHPGKIVSGRILLHGENLLELPMDRMKKIRGDRISMIFQEPMISLNPAFTIGNQLTEALPGPPQHHQKAEAEDRAMEMLRIRWRSPVPERRIKDYPHQLSGGMRQRVMIAEAMLLKPDVLLADEPTTALDVTVQAHVLDLMYRLGREMGTAIMLVTHNLGMVAEYAQRVVVMYAGRVVEEGSVKAIFDETSHPYTSGLLKSIPVPGQRRAMRPRSRCMRCRGSFPVCSICPPGAPSIPDVPRKKKSAPGNCRPGKTLAPAIMSFAGFLHDGWVNWYERNSQS